MRAESSEGSRAAVERRILGVAYGVHALHDGYADALHYLLLPLWRAEFGLSYALVGVMRALYSGTMATFQRPSAHMADRRGSRIVLAIGTALVGVGYLVAGVSSALPLLVVSLLVGGLGSSTQHPVASSVVAAASEGSRSRGRLATYNFAGDVGKMAVPALTAWLLTLWPWRPAMLLLGTLALAGSGAVLLLPRQCAPASAPAPSPGESASSAPGAGTGHGFPLLLTIGIIDSATRMGFLTFLPYLLTAKGASLGTLGLSLTLVFAGGAAGKLVCGFLGARFGVIATVFLTEGLTAAGILAILPAPLPLALGLLPLIGVCLNGTSSVLYGTVPELVPPERRTRAFSVFYTGTIGAGAISPALYGTIGDLANVPTMLVVVALLVLLTLPLAWRLRVPLLVTSRLQPGPAA